MGCVLVRNNDDAGGILVMHRHNVMRHHHSTVQTHSTVQDRRAYLVSEACVWMLRGSGVLVGGFCAMVDVLVLEELSDLCEDGVEYRSRM